MNPTNIESLSFSKPKNGATILTIQSDTYTLSSNDCKITDHLLFNVLDSLQNDTDFVTELTDHKNSLVITSTSKDTTITTDKGITKEYAVDFISFATALVSSFEAYSLEWSAPSQYWYYEKKLSPKKYEEYLQGFSDQASQLLSTCNNIKNLINQKECRK